MKNYILAMILIVVALLTSGFNGSGSYYKVEYGAITDISNDFNSSNYKGNIILTSQELNTTLSTWESFIGFFYPSISEIKATFSRGSTKDDEKIICPYGYDYDTILGKCVRTIVIYSYRILFLVILLISLLLTYWYFFVFKRTKNKRKYWKLYATKKILKDKEEENKLEKIKKIWTKKNINQEQ